MDIRSKEFLDTIPTQPEAILIDGMVYARFYHPDTGREYFVTHYEVERDGFGVIVKFEDEKNYRFNWYICIDSLLTGHSPTGEDSPYLLDEDFVPIRVYELLSISGDMPKVDPVLHRFAKIASSIRFY